ncbi:MAG: DUF1800 family protein [Planctomycetota bacterium]
MDRWLAAWQPDRDNPYDISAVVHLLRRTALGHPTSLIARCREAGPTDAVRLLMSGEAPSESEVRLAESLPLVLASEKPDDLGGFWWARLLLGSHPLALRMSLFWHDHFATSIQKVKSSYWMSEQLASFDRHGLGHFRTLLLEVAKGPAMIRWLDNESNRKGRPNENFAREVFELFTLGRDHYSEDDIKEAARAFTGWRISRERFFFDRQRHDAGNKTIFGRSGRFGGEDVMAMAVEREDCARFLAGKLLASFVGPEYPSEARAELAHVFREHDGHIGRCLEVLLGSRLFFDPKIRGTRVKGPVEWIVWFMRSLELFASPKALNRAASRMGQRLLWPPDVAGWDEEGAWISSATWLQRVNLAGRIGTKPFHLDPALEEVVPAGSPEAELGWFVERLFPEGLATAARSSLEAQARGEARLSRPVRLSGLLRACLMLPEAHRF